MPLSRARKEEYFVQMEELLDQYTKILCVTVDNVGSKQIQQIRAAIRGSAVVLMGKNTMMRKVIGGYLKKNPGHPCEALLPRIKGNVGFVFTNSDLGKIRDLLESNKVPAPARVGAVAPCDVVVPPGPTGCDPGQTAFFQTLQIATKISKGQIEIITPVELLTKGTKVGSSEAALLQKLSINPFTYGMEVTSIYDNGSIFDAAVLDLTDDDLKAKFQDACRNVAALSLALGIPTLASLPHSIANAFRTLVAITVQLEEFTFDKAEPYKAFLKDPSAFIAATGGGGGGGGGGDAAPAAAEEKKEEEEEEVDMGGGMDMFGGSDY